MRANSTYETPPATDGLFLAFEGLDGTGKTTAIAGVAEWLREIGHTVVLCREPGGTGIGDGIRQLLLTGETKVDGVTALFLFSAARRHLLRTVVRPALERGEIVICDRFALSTFAYQGAQGVSHQVIHDITSHAVGNTWPTTIVLDATHEVRMARLRARSGFADQFEEASMRAGTIIESVYRAANLYVPNCHTVDANGTPDECLANLQRAILSIRPNLAHVTDPRIVGGHAHLASQRRLSKP